MPYYVAAPVREPGDVIMHLQGPEFFLVHKWCVSPRPVSILYWLLCHVFFEEATWESSTIIGLLYAHEALIVARRYDVPWDWLWDACHMAGVRWGSRCDGFRSKEGPHYRFTRSVRNMTINLIHELEIPWGFHTWAVLCSSAGAYVTRKSVGPRIFVSKKGMIRARPMDVCTRNLWRKAESILLRETKHAGLEIWGRMNDVLPRSLS